MKSLPTRIDSHRWIRRAHRKPLHKKHSHAIVLPPLAVAVAVVVAVVVVLHLAKDLDLVQDQDTRSRPRIQTFLLKIMKLDLKWFHMAYGSIWAHIKTGRSQMAEDHFLNPLDPQTAYGLPKVS